MGGGWPGCRKLSGAELQGDLPSADTLPRMPSFSLAFHRLPATPGGDFWSFILTQPVGSRVCASIAQSAQWAEKACLSHTLRGGKPVSEPCVEKSKHSKVCCNSAVLKLSL